MNQCRRQFVRLKSKRPRSALVCDAALRVDQIYAVWPAGIGSFSRVAKLVEHGGKFNPKLSHASAGDECSFFLSLRARKNNFVFDVAFHLPNITRMRFGYVNNQESHAIAILFVKLIESRNLPPEWRSRVAAEYQNHRLQLV